MFDKDLATGKLDVEADYASSGLRSAFTASGMPSLDDRPRCYVWDVFETCTPEEQQILANGTAVTDDFILVGRMLLDGSIAYFHDSGSTH